MAKAYLIDMDGVLLRGSEPIPGAAVFIGRLREAQRPFLVLTNNSLFTPEDLCQRLHSAGLEVPVDRIYTSAMATAQFLTRQRPNGRAFVLGEAGLLTALHAVGYRVTEYQPDYVVLGETTNYSFPHIARAVRFVAAGVRFIATNPDVSGPTERGLVPATGALAALITAATGVRPYFVGKPNPLMIRSALRHLGTHSEETVMIGDRMDTDIIAGIESGMSAILTLTGVTKPEEVDRFPYRPDRIVKSLEELDSV